MMRATKAESNNLFTETWEKIVGSLNEVYDVVTGERAAVAANNMSSRMAWYTLTYNAATKDHLVAEKLYEQLRLWIEQNLEKRVTKPVLEMAKKGDSQALFQMVTKAYSQFKINVQFGCIVFHYLGSYVTKRSNHDTIDQMYMKGFNKAVYANVKHDLLGVILQQVNSRRDGNQIDLGQLKAAVAIFIDVGTATAPDEKGKTEVYFNDFEKHYLEALKSVYRQRSVAQLSSDGGHFTYLQWVESRQDLEMGLAGELLRQDSHDKVRQATEEELIRPHMKTVVQHPESGFGILLEDWREGDLSRMYKLMKRVPNNEALNLMGQAMTQRIEVEGKEIIEAFMNTVSSAALDIEKPCVEAVMALDAKYGGLIRTHFENHVVFHGARKEAFTKFLKADMKRKDAKGSGTEEFTTRATSFPEVLATYCDAVMKRELKDIIDPDAELERLDALLQIFTYVKEKDIFQEYYKSKLAKRLLQTTPNEELEKNFLVRLQREMGKSFTHKMEGMLVDRETTKQHAEKFATDPASRGLTCEFQCQVLTAGHWPSYKGDKLTPPPSLRQAQDAFERFYKKRYVTRNLAWINMLGQATMMITFAKGTKEVTGSVYQAAVLAQLDDAGTLTAGKVAELLTLDPKTVRPHIASMLLHKTYTLLVKVDDTGEALPVGKNFTDDEKIALNPAFQHKTRKFKLPTAAGGGGGGGGGSGEPTDPEIEARRKIQVDACIVRVMKSRRTLQYNELQDLVIQQLSKLFTPQPKMIKTRVEDLIPRGYLKRDDDGPTQFHYLA